MKHLILFGIISLALFIGCEPSEEQEMKEQLTAAIELIGDDLIYFSVLNQDNSEVFSGYHNTNTSSIELNIYDSELQAIHSLYTNGEWITEQLDILYIHISDVTIQDAVFNDPKIGIRIGYNLLVFLH